MNLYPRIESRLSALERQQAQTNARFEEVIEDMNTNFKHITTDIEASFKQFAEYSAKVEAEDERRFHKIEGRLDKIEGRLDKIEITMATKEDLAVMATKEELRAMETRILDAFQQLITTINRQGEK
jgi:hypothetical protein